MQVGGLFLIWLHKAGIDLIADEQEYVNERHFVRREISGQLAVLLVFRRINSAEACA
ncbi:MAG: hypothetical protein ACLU3I_19420 [Acutalibacteraceae bacterium]